MLNLNRESLETVPLRSGNEQNTSKLTSGSSLHSLKFGAKRFPSFGFLDEPVSLKGSIIYEGLDQ